MKRQEETGTLTESIGGKTRKNRVRKEIKAVNQKLGTRGKSIICMRVSELINIQNNMIEN